MIAGLDWGRPHWSISPYFSQDISMDRNNGTIPLYFTTPPRLPGTVDSP